MRKKLPEKCYVLSTPCPLCPWQQTTLLYIVNMAISWFHLLFSFSPSSIRSICKTLCNLMNLVQSSCLQLWLSVQGKMLSRIYTVTFSLCPNFHLLYFASCQSGLCHRSQCLNCVFKLRNTSGNVLKIKRKNTSTHCCHVKGCWQLKNWNSVNPQKHWLSKYSQEEI